MTALVAESLRALRCRVHVVDTRDARGIENIGRLDVANVFLGLRHAAQVWSATILKRPDVTIFPISQASLPLIRDLLCLAVPCLIGSRIVLHLHGSALGLYRAQTSLGMRFLLRILGRRTWRAVVLAEVGRENFRGMVPDHRIRVLPNAVPDTPYRASPGADGRRFRVVYLANLDPAKGYLDVLDAAALAAPQIPGFELLVAGAWYRGREQAERLLAAPPLRDVARLVGVVAGLAKTELLAGADVFVFPPRQREGQPLVLLEAMAAGLPIVTTGSGFIPETVCPGENAVLVPPGHPQALADALKSLHRDRPRLAMMGQSSRRRYLELYTPDRFRDRLAGLLQEGPVDEQSISPARALL